MVIDGEKQEWLIERFESIGAIEQGHFRGNSGRHLDRYVVKDMVTSHPRLLDELANLMTLLNDRLWANKVDIILAPAVGAVVLGGMLANHLDCRFAYTEKDFEGKHRIRDSFLGLFQTGTRVLISEDIVTSGGTLNEVADLVAGFGATVVGASVLWVRGKNVTTQLSLVSLIQKELPDWDEKDCPLCKHHVEINTKHGHGIEFLMKNGTYPDLWPANKK